MFLNVASSLNPSNCFEKFLINFLVEDNLSNSSIFEKKIMICLSINSTSLRTDWNNFNESKSVTGATKHT